MAYDSNSTLTIGDTTFSNQDLKGWYNQVEGDASAIARDATKFGATSEQITQALNIGGGYTGDHFTASAVTDYVDQKMPSYVWADDTNALTEYTSPASTTQYEYTPPTAQEPVWTQQDQNRYDSQQAELAYQRQQEQAEQEMMFQQQQLAAQQEHDALLYQQQQEQAAGLLAAQQKRDDLLYQRQMDAMQEQKASNAAAQQRIAAANQPVSVDPSHTIAAQMEGLIANPNTPYMQQAATSGLQQANQRGLLNSSMAAGAAQDASMRAAFNIASGDSQAYMDQSQLNQQQNLQYTQLGENARQFSDKLALDGNMFNQQLAWDREESGRNFTEGVRQYDQDMAQWQQNFDENVRQYDQGFSEDARRFDENLAWSKKQFGKNLNYQYDTMGDENKMRFANYLQNARGNYDSYVQAIKVDPDLTGDAKQRLMDDLYSNFVTDTQMVANLYNIPLTMEEIGNPINLPENVDIASLSDSELNSWAVAALNGDVAAMPSLARYMHNQGISAERMYSLYGTDPTILSVINAEYGTDYMVKAA